MFRMPVSTALEQIHIPDLGHEVTDPMGSFHNESS